MTLSNYPLWCFKAVCDVSEPIRLNGHGASVLHDCFVFSSAVSCPCDLLTFVTLCQALILWLDQSDSVVDVAPVHTPLHSGGLLVNLCQIFHVPVLGFELFLQTGVPPRPPVLRQSFQQRGEDAVVLVGEVGQCVRRVSGRPEWRNQLEAAGDKQQQSDSAKTTKGS